MQAEHTPAGRTGSEHDLGTSLHHDAPLTRDRLEEAARVFRLLADPTRLALLAVLTRGPADVTTLAEAGGASRTSTSQHLAKLRLAGLVSTSRDGRHIRYALRGGHLSRLVAEALNHADHEVSGEPHHG